MYLLVGNYITVASSYKEHGVSLKPESVAANTQGVTAPDSSALASALAGIESEIMASMSQDAVTNFDSTQSTSDLQRSSLQQASSPPAAEAQEQQQQAEDVDILAYGADWCWKPTSYSVTNAERESELESERRIGHGALVGSCSFYDKELHLWEHRF